MSVDTHAPACPEHLETLPTCSDVTRRSDDQVVGESEHQRVERLGRERPPQFASLWAEIAFVSSILLSQIMVEYFVSGFNVILPTLVKDLDIPSDAVVWPAAAFALTTSAFLLPMGRLGDMHGGYPVFVIGLAWFSAWSLITGFSQNELMLDCCRAMEGLGPAAILSCGMQLMGKVYRPGPRKNLVFSLWGASAVIGFFFGIFVAGLTGEYLRFGWYFWIGSLLIFTNLILAIFAIPNDMVQQKALGIKMDWLGSSLIVSGLVLLIFSLTDGSHAPNRWENPYILVTLILSIICLAGAVYVELYIAEVPLIPKDIFYVPYLKPLFLALIFSYGCLGIFLLYSTLYMQQIMGATSLQVTAWFVPCGLGGMIISVVGGHIFDRISGTLLIIIGALGWVLTSLLFAVAPEGANYWAYVFPAMIGATIGIDITYNVANIFITTNLSSKRQGLAGALVSSLPYLGIAFLLSFADITQTQTAHLGLQASYHAVFWYQLGCATTSLVIILVFVRVKEAKSDLTADEKEVLANEKRLASTENKEEQKM